LAVQLRQQQPPGRNFTFLKNTHYNLCFNDSALYWLYIGPSAQIVRNTIFSECLVLHDFQL
jgi:hypothetical protein